MQARHTRVCRTLQRQQETPSSGRAATAVARNVAPLPCFLKLVIHTPPAHPTCLPDKPAPPCHTHSTTCAACRRLIHMCLHSPVSRAELSSQPPPPTTLSVLPASSPRAVIAHLPPPPTSTANGLRSGGSSTPCCHLLRLHTPTPTHLPTQATNTLATNPHTALQHMHQ